MPARNELLSDAAWLSRRYVTDEAPISQIAADAGADLSTVHLWLQRHEIPTRRYDIVRAEVEEMLAEGYTPPEIAREMEVDRAVIYDRLYRWGLAIPAGAVECDYDQLRQWYIGQQWPIQRIAGKLGISRRATTRVLLAAGVTLRGPGRRRG